MTARINRDLPLSAFHGMAFDDRGRLHVVTAPLGVLRRDDDHWTRLTPEWPLLRGPNDATLDNLSGLVVRGSLLVIATWGMGVVVRDVDTGKVRRIPFDDFSWMNEQDTGSYPSASAATMIMSPRATTTRP